METLYRARVCRYPVKCFEPTYKEWKLRSGRGFNSEGLGFEPTYKEWKPLVLLGTPAHAPGFEPTYKEWKLFHHTPAVAHLQGFEPTYKEWKLLRGPLEISLVAQVLSLPTRNGNIY